MLFGKPGRPGVGMLATGGSLGMECLLGVCWISLAVISFVVVSCSSDAVISSSSSTGSGFGVCDFSARLDFSETQVFTYITDTLLMGFSFSVVQ